MNEISLEAKLVAESGVVSWGELSVHYERGVMITVGPTVDLITVAAAVARDQAEQVSGWLASGVIERTSEKDVVRWGSDKARLRAVVVAPWVLVQERLSEH